MSRARWTPMQRRVASFVMFAWVAVVSFAGERSSTAAIPGCFADNGDPGVFARRTTIDVWIHIDNTPGAQDLRWATGLSQLDLDRATPRALAAWNEASGAAVKLRYRGPTTSTANPPNGIIVRASQLNENANCSGQCDCAGAGIVKPNALAQAVGAGSNGIRTSGYIRFFRRTLNGANPPVCVTHAFNLTEDSPLDVVTILIHELGHLVFDMDHPDEANTDCGPDAATAISVMNSRSGFDKRARVLKDFEIQLAQERYISHRGWDSGAILRSKMTGTTSWQTPFTISGYASHKPVQRMGSLGSSYTGAPRFISYVSAVSSTPQVAGVGAIRLLRYRSSFDVPIANSALPRPIAVAIRPGSNELFMAYHKRSTAPYVVGSDIAFVCYRTSLDAGVTWTAEQCPANAKAYRSGVSATYEPVSATFVAGFIGDDSGVVPFNSKKIAFLVVPSSINSITPVAVTVASQTTARSWHAPSVACRNAGSTCRAYFEAATNAGTLSWFDFSVSTLLGTVTGFSTTTVGPFLAFDAPSAVWDPAVSSYRIVNSIGGAAIYSYRDSNGVLVGTGDVWNDSGPSSNSFVSSGVISRNASAQTWFMRYW